MKSSKVIGARAYARANGLKVIDSRSSLEVAVTLNDVKHAQVKNSRACAFAQGLQREDKEIVAVFFYRTIAWVAFSDKIVRYRLPVSIQKEITSFDRSGSMEPGTYSLSRIPKSLKVGRPTKKRLASNTKKTKVKRPVHRTQNVRSAFWAPR